MKKHTENLLEIGLNVLKATVIPAFVFAGSFIITLDHRVTANASAIEKNKVLAERDIGYIRDNIDHIREDVGDIKRHLLK